MVGTTFELLLARPEKFDLFVQNLIRHCHGFLPCEKVVVVELPRRC